MPCRYRPAPWVTAAMARGMGRTGPVEVPGERRFRRCPGREARAGCQPSPVGPITEATKSLRSQTISEPDSSTS
jgi:hypothetical protein